MPYRSLVNQPSQPPVGASGDLQKPELFDGTGGAALLGAVAGGIVGYLVGSLISEAPSEDKMRESLGAAALGAAGGAVFGGFLGHGAYVDGYEAAARAARRTSA